MASFFSGRAGRNAAVAAEGILSNAQDRAYDLIGQGRDQASQRLSRGYRLYERGFSNGMGALTAGYDASKPHLQAGIDTWQGVHDQGKAGATAYADATGANGAEGYGRAVNNFHTGPGYQFNMDEMLDAVNRSAASRGMLSSGNTTSDLMTKASGIANQEFGNYVSRLQPFLSMYTQGAQGLSGAHESMADLETGYGKDMAQMQVGRADKLAGVNMARAALDSDAANNRANLLLDIAGQIAPIRMQGMMAGQQAAANRFGAVMGAVDLGTKLLGLGTGNGGTVGGKLFSMMGG